MTQLRTAILAPLGLSLAACAAVGPDYIPPTAELPAAYAEAPDAKAEDAKAEDAGARQLDPGPAAWWRAFNDPILDDLIATGLAQNLDVDAALARVAEARAALRAAGVNSQLSGAASADTTWSGELGGEYGGRADGAGISAGFVIDLFGGARRGREAAAADLQSAQLSVGTARLALISDLVSAYLDARYYQEAAAINRSNIRSRSETLALTRRQRQAGAGTDLDVAQAQALLDATRATLPTYETGFITSVYSIATLLDAPAAPLLERLSAGAPQPRPPRGAEAGVPADLLRDRPDIAAAERDYAAAVAAIGVSEAELYPSLSLDGAISLASVSTWSFGPTLSLPLLNRPTLEAQVDQARARAAQAEIAWRGAVRDAVEEVQAAQSTLIRGRRQAAALRTAADSYTRVVDLSQDTWRAGQSTLLDLLDAERSRGTARISLAGALRDVASSWAQLQIAAGRGWR